MNNEDRREISEGLSYLAMVMVVNTIVIAIPILDYLEVISTSTAGIALLGVVVAFGLVWLVRAAYGFKAVVEALAQDYADRIRREIDYRLNPPEKIRQRRE